MVRVRRVPVLVAVVAAALGAWAPPSGAHDDAVDRRRPLEPSGQALILGGEARGDAEPHAQAGVLRRLRRLVERHDGAVVAGEGTAASDVDDTTDDADLARAVGDLSGDGLPDVATVVGLWGTYEDGAAWIGARRGTDGEVLFSVPRPAGDYHGFLAADVAGGGRPGLLALSYVSDYDDPAGTGYEVTALDGDGSERWSRFLSNGASSTPLGTRRLVTFEIVDALPGPEDDLVLAYDSGGILTTEVIDGATGASSPWPLVGVPAPGHGFDDLFAVDDVSGDDMPDLVAVSYGGARRAEVHLFDARTGLLRWRSGEVATRDFLDAWTVDDVTGDGIADVVLRPSSWHGGPSDAVLLDGALGTVQWRREGEAPFALGDVDDDGVDEVGTMAFALLDDRVEARFSAVRGTGAVAWTHVQELPFHELRTDVYGLLDVAGDADADGLRDLVLYLDTYDIYTREYDVLHGIWVAADGAMPWQVGEDNELGLVTPLGGTTDGDGADVRSRTYGANSAEVVLDGRTGAERWRRSTSSLPYRLDDVVDLDGDGVDELIYADGKVTVVEGRDGRDAW